MSGYKLWQHPDNGRWYITWSEGRRSRRLTTGTRDREQAEFTLATFIIESTKPEDNDPATIPLADVLDRYMARHGEGLPSAHQARIAIADMKDFYKAGSVESITAKSHDDYRRYILDKGLSLSTVNRRRAVLRAALKEAVKRGELRTAPFIPAEPEPAPRESAMTRQQAARLLRVAHRRKREVPYLALFIRIALYTGARRNAILELTWDRVDLETGAVDFRLPGKVHKRKRRAVTALPSRLLASLRRLKERSRCDYVISHHGEPVGSIKKSFRRTAAMAGLPWVTPHVLKHTAVTWALRAVSPWMVEGMTATSLRTLQRVYGKHMTADLQTAANAVAQSGVRKSRYSGILRSGGASVVGATGIEPVTPTMSSKGSGQSTGKKATTAYRKGG